MSRNEKPQKKRGSGRLLLYLMVFLVLGGGGLLLCAAGRYALRGNQIIRDGGADTLTVAERVYLQTLLTPRVDEIFGPANSLTSETELEIPFGSGAGQIADQLATAGVLQDRDLFLNYVRYYGLDAQLEAGYFVIPPGVTLAELAVFMTASRDPFIILTVLEGWRLEEIAQAIRDNPVGQIDPEQFLALARRRLPFDLTPYDFLTSLPAEATLEGYLFPDTYQLPLEATAETVLQAMLDNFNQQVDPAMRQGFGLQNLSLHEAVTLASIVQREAVHDFEKPVIAGVFHNRLADGMRLEADPTVQYAVGYQADSGRWWKSGLTLSDLQIDSPYNTYRYPGLMPGPIANPGRAALAAVANPEPTDAIFFVVDCTAETPNTHIFSRTYEEHLANVQRCR